MAKFCPDCKKEYNDEALFCAECGASLEEVIIPEPEAVPQHEPQYTPDPEPAPAPAPAPAPQAEPQYIPEPEPVPAPQPAQPVYQYQQPQQPYSQPQYQTQYQPAPVKEELFPAVKTAVYFWLNIAMMIPFVGFILSIVLTCAPKNKSLKNYARAYLIANLLVVGLGVLILILSLVLGGGLFAMASGASSSVGW